MVQYKKMQVFCGESSSPKKSLFLKKTFLQPWLIGQLSEKWDTLVKFGGIWCLFPFSSTIGIPNNWERTDQRSPPRGRKAPNIYSSTKLLFLHLSRNRFQKSERIFCWLSKLRHVLGSLAFCHQNWARLQFWYFATRIGQNSNFGILPPKLGKTPSRSKTAN